jgi:hemerythrin-like domain-containing protein
MSFKTELLPYATLAREHRLIERGLEVLRRFCDEIVRTKSVDATVAREILRFLREFADRVHHLKEERILFPAIESSSFFPGCGLVSEHELGRTRVRNMAAAVDRSLAGDEAARKVFIQQARSYISLLQAHIAKEDDCLANVTANSFPSSTERERLAREFDELERLEVGERAFERFAALVETLEARVSPQGD